MDAKCKPGAKHEKENEVLGDGSKSRTNEGKSVKRFSPGARKSGERSWSCRRMAHGILLAEEMESRGKLNVTRERCGRTLGISDEQPTICCFRRSGVSSTYVGGTQEEAVLTVISFRLYRTRCTKVLPIPCAGARTAPNQRERNFH